MAFRQQGQHLGPSRSAHPAGPAPVANRLPSAPVAQLGVGGSHTRCPTRHHLSAGNATSHRALSCRPQRGNPCVQSQPEWQPHAVMPGVAPHAHTTTSGTLLHPMSAALKPAQPCQSQACWTPETGPTATAVAPMLHPQVLPGMTFNAVRPCCAGDQLCPGLLPRGATSNSSGSMYAQQSAHSHLPSQRHGVTAGGGMQSLPSVKPANPGTSGITLTAEQQEVVDRALAWDDYILVMGLPGAGKTYTIAACVQVGFIASFSLLTGTCM